MKTHTGGCSTHKDIIQLQLAPLKKKKKSLNKGQHKSSAKEEKGSHLAQ